MTLLGNGVIITGGPGSRVLSGAAVVWQSDTIVAVDQEEALRSRFKDARYLDARGGLIVPGFVNLHHHFYSVLARGLDPGMPTRSFEEILEALWWRLDRALAPETIHLSALLSAAECVRWGTTTVFDHHSSPSSIRGSLELIAKAIETAGLSAVLCYEMSDRNGHRIALEGLDENLELIKRRRKDPRVRGTIGLHASFTVNDDSLAAVAVKRPQGVGCHLHLAEDPLDAQVSTRVFHATPLQRLESAGLLDDRALLAHCIHLEDDDYTLIARRNAVVVHNPESNANNGVGRLDLSRALAAGCRVGLGTDGMSSSMVRALRAAFLGHRAGHRDPSSGLDVLPRLLETNADVARHFFEEPLLGQLTQGAPADIAVIDCVPPSPINSDNATAHLVYGAAESPVRHTIARGSVLLRDFVHTTLDPEQLAASARDLTPRLWDRFHSLTTTGHERSARP
jgi:putative selenium metabolism protein SsnA